MLRPHETEKSLRTFWSLGQSTADREHAKKAVERATSKVKQIYMLTQSDSRRMSIPQQIRIRLLQAVKHEYLAAKTMLASVNRRADLVIEFIRETKLYNSLIQDASRQRLLLPWVWNQVPLLEVELIQSKAKVFSSSGIKSTKRKLDVCDDSLEKRNFKKQKSNHQKIGLLVDDGIATQAKKNEENHQQILNDDERSMPRNMIRRSKAKKPSIDQFGCFSALSQPTRRSARIAARQTNVDMTFPPKSLMKDSQPQLRAELRKSFKSPKSRKP